MIRKAATPIWFKMFNYAVEEAERLGMNIDLTPSSGWCMGGPHISRQNAEQSFSVINGKIEPLGLDASVWPLKPSGLLGPVKLIPVQIDNF